MRILTEFQTDPTSRHGPAAGPVWLKADDLDFAADASAEDALAAAIGNGLEHLAGNEACVLGRFHPEGVHQMRVAVRRLRSRLAIYAGLIAEDQRRHADREMKWLIRRLGPARDWDVFIDEVLGPVVAGLGDLEPALGRLRDAARAEQDRAYRRAGKAIESDRYRAGQSWLADWRADHGWRGVGYPDPAWAVLIAPAKELAAAVLAARHSEVLSLGEHLATMTPEERHALRIRIKALRYAVEFFAGLYSDNAVQPYLAGLKGLQDDLGQLNDLVVARTLMTGLIEAADKASRTELALATGLVLGWHGHNGHHGDGIAAPWQQFVACEPFWA